MTRTRFAPLALCLIGASAAIARGQDGHTLAYRTSEGSKADWTIASVTSGEITIVGTPQGEQKESVAVDMSVSYHTDDKADADGKLVFEVGLDRFAVKQARNGKPVSDIVMDAEGITVGGQVQEKTDRVAKQLEMFQGAVARFTMPATGDPVDVKELRPEVAAVDLSTLVLLPRPCLPADAGPHQIGATWKGQRTAHSAFKLDDGPAVLDCDYVLKAVEDGIATIAVTGKAESKDTGGQNERGVRIKIARIAHQIAGSFQLDVAAGQVVGSKLTLDTELEAIPAGMPQAKLLMKTTVVYTLTRAEATGDEKGGEGD